MKNISNDMKRELALYHERIKSTLMNEFSQTPKREKIGFSEFKISISFLCRADKAEFL